MDFNHPAVLAVITIILIIIIALLSRDYHRKNDKDNHWFD